MTDADTRDLIDALSDVSCAFPVQSYRPYQRETLERIAEAFSSGVKCVLLDAPTGFGKSYVNAAFCRIMQSFYATPQLSLIDQLLADRNLHGYFTEIKGHANYFCVHDPQYSTNLCLMKRNKDFKCDKMNVCPYWIQKQKALKAQTALMSFAYLILEGFTETPYSFGKRKLLVLDEAHSIDRYAVEHLGFQISPYSIPSKIYEKLVPHLHEYKTIDQVRVLVEAAQDFAKEQLESYDMTLDGRIATVQNLVHHLKLEEFVQKSQQFLDTQPFTEWIWQLGYITLKDAAVKKRLTLMPLYAKRFMADLVWKKADLFIVSSATILDPKIFVAETGLDSVLNKSEILYLQIPSTFPPENRRIIDVTVGKMTKNNIDQTLPKVTEKIKEIIKLEKGKNIAIHCHSYRIAVAIEKALRPEYGGLLITHESADRQDALERWKNSHGKVFISVAFEEGQDWKGEIAGAQIIVKTPFPDLEDRRVAKRLEYKQWRWYWIETLKRAMQMYGRVVRAPDEVKNTYVLDTSYFDLISRSWRYVPQWFKDALPVSKNKDLVVKEK